MEAVPVLVPKSQMFLYIETSVPTSSDFGRQRGLRIMASSRISGQEPQVQSVRTVDLCDLPSGVVISMVCIHIPFVRICGEHLKTDYVLHMRNCRHHTRLIRRLTHGFIFSYIFSLNNIAEMNVFQLSRVLVDAKIKIDT